MLEEGRIIPNSNMCLNSLRATWRRSGDKRRARAETGGPVVLMWCVTSCFGGALVGCGCCKVLITKLVVWPSGTFFADYSC